MEALDAPVGPMRRLVSSFLLVTVGVLGLSGLPKYVEAQDTVRDWIDPAVVGLGLWQTRWELYAPSPDSTNAAIVGVVQFEDDLRAEWRSPDWHALSWRGKLRYFRHAEYVDGARRNSNPGMWAPLARHLARSVQHPVDESVRPVRVELWRHWVNLPEPEEPLRPFADPFPLESKYRFHVEELD